MKTIKHKVFFCGRARQGGAVLVTGLIFLAVLTILGVTSARMSSLEERMSGNMRDRSLAMQAAELALRDAERDITVNSPGSISYTGVRDVTSSTPDCGLSTATMADDGLCGRGGNSLPTYTVSTITWPAFVDISGNNFQKLSVDMTLAAPPSVGYQEQSGVPTAQKQAIAGVSAQPRYIIETFQKTAVAGGSSGAPVNYYRITVRAQGANPSTVVWLQEVFTPM
jgi:type IV pilus assembly protein PilX